MARHVSCLKINWSLRLFILNQALPSTTLYGALSSHHDYTFGHSKCINGIGQAEWTCSNLWCIRLWNCQLALFSSATASLPQIVHWSSYCWKRLGKNGRETESCCLCCCMRRKCLNISINQYTWMALVVPSSAASLLHQEWLREGMSTTMRRKISSWWNFQKLVCFVAVDREIEQQVTTL